MTNETETQTIEEQPPAVESEGVEQPSAQMPAVIEPPEPIELPEESKKNPRELFDRYLKIGKHGDSLKVEGDMPIEEFLPLLDHLTRQNEVGAFFIGDLIIYGSKQYGDGLGEILQMTGRKVATLQAYATVAKACPPSMRRQELTWSHHQVVASIANNEEAGGKEKAKLLLKQAADGVGEGDKKEVMPVATFKKIVAEAKPAKTKTTKPSSGKPGRKTKTGKDKKAAAKPAREMKPEEVAAMDSFYEEKVETFKTSLNELMNALWEKPDGETELIDVIRKGDNAVKKGFVHAMPERADLLKLHSAINSVDDLTGY